ncbi:MAG: hypothetical protein ACT4PT_12610 [Methanobacteriota archaeon]
MPSKRARDLALGALLLALAVLGPMVGYAGVNVVWPASTITADVDENPPIDFLVGADHTTAQNLGFAGAFTATNNAASFTLTVNGLSGGNVTVDNITYVNKESAITSYKIQIATALGAGINPTSFKVRLYTGSAPTSDGSAGVCAVLDLEAAANTESSAACTATNVAIQVVYELPAGQTTQSDSVSIRPSSIVVA